MSRTAEIAPAWRDRLAAAGMRDIEALLSTDAPEAVAAGSWQALSKPGLGGRRRWRWQLPGDADATVLFVKRYAETPLRAQLDRIRRQSARHSRAWWEYHQSLRLDAARIPAPRAVAYVEEMRGTLEHCSAVLLEHVPGDAFDRVWTKLATAGAPVAKGRSRHDLTRRLARFVAAFHQTGLSHRDLYLCHIFVQIDADGRVPPAFSLIDLARTHAPRWRRMRWLLKDLSQLDSSAREMGATRGDRMRFLLAYLGLEPRALRTRWYAPRIIRRSDRILARVRRKQAASRR